MLNTTSFLPKFCHYALNVHVYPFFDCDTDFSSSDLMAISPKSRSISLATSRISGHNG